MSEEMPVAVWSGTFRLGSVDLRCHVLSDGTRVIEEASVIDFLDSVEAIDPKEVEAFARWRLER